VPAAQRPSTPPTSASACVNIKNHGRIARNRGIAANKAELDRLRPLAPRALENFDRAYDLELTYTSNAIEGNALT
jgi:hypothetical protein